ncbi:MAG: 50S ribosomal protein L32 [Candidatus Tectomicrobia bacterium]|uniref:Large ribosomal subunit protein bL32 n=1 Tax=Tectimicrobiota bacterium TaxID=2528274 RepID=A0A933LR18_UNCTE|nr:50S ribosomal protein L32 [Candidatus Tectomicrobia bacterium]
MAVPKRRQSKARRDKRRTHKKLVAPAIALCPHCHEATMAYGVCPSCGTYKGKEYLPAKEA